MQKQPPVTRLFRPPAAIDLPPDSLPEPDIVDVEGEPTPVRGGGRKIHESHRRFVHEYAQTGFLDPDAAARAAGFLTRGIGHELIERLADLIEQERARRTVGTTLAADEAFQRLAEIARDDSDPKTALAALRTWFELHGMLSRSTPPDDRKKLVREIEEIASRFKQLKGGIGGIRALVTTGARGELGVPGAFQPASEIEAVEGVELHKKEAMTTISPAIQASRGAKV